MAAASGTRPATTPFTQPTASAIAANTSRSIHSAAPRMREGNEVACSTPLGTSIAEPTPAPK